MRRALGVLAVTCALAAGVTGEAAATPVCTDNPAVGSPPESFCGDRIFPEAHNATAYVQYTENPAGFSEYRDGIAYLAEKYPRWISVFSLRDRYGDKAVSSGPDGIRSTDPGDTGDGRDIYVIKITDHDVPDAGKRNLLFSLSVHGNERGGLEGGLRAAEDLAMAATQGGKIADGFDNYESTTGRKPVFHEREVRDLLAEEAVYLVDFNVDGWAIGDIWASPAPQPFSRGNSLGTDLNRQMPTVGRINPARNPLQEAEMLFGTELMRAVAKAGRGGLMDYGADVHGELTSQAYTDIMYPAGQFDSIDHRRLMAIAERTKSVIDATLFDGIVDEIENADGGNEQEGSLSQIPTKPAHWATVWDTLGYTDTGFIGDYLATDLGVTGMDYEIFLNHTVPDKAWNVYLQANHITSTRSIIKTAMAYAPFQQDEFNKSNFAVDPKGRPGYVANPDTVTDTDEDGPGTLPGPAKDGIGQDGKPVAQAHYEATNQRFFADQSELMTKPFVGLAAADVARDPAWLDYVDTLVLADTALPADTKGRPVDRAAYFANVRAWVERGGNLVLTDKALHALAEIGLVPAAAVTDVAVYQPYANMTALDHPLAEGLRPNARQLVEAPPLGYGIGNDASPMTVVATEAWQAAGGTTVGTTGDAAGTTDDGTLTSVGEVALGKGKVRIVGGALPTPTETNDHRFGLRDYALTYTGLFILENAVEHDMPGLGERPLPSDAVVPPRPGKKRCVSGRRLRVRVPKRAGKRVRVRVNGKRVRVKRVKGRRVAVVKLRRRMAGRKLVIRIERRSGNRWKKVGVRRVRVCRRR